MNICFLMGKIKSEIEFKFIVNSKIYYSVVIFQLELSNKNIVKIKGYNKIADYCYRILKKDKNISVLGKLNSKGEIEIFEIYE